MGSVGVITSIDQSIERAERALMNELQSALSDSIREAIGAIVIPNERAFAAALGGRGR